MMKRIGAAMFLGGMLLVASVHAGASDCDLDSGTLDRGERKTFLLCGDGMTANTGLGGLEESGIEVLYRQPLHRCDVDDRRPGFFLVLRAGSDATGATIVTNGPGEDQSVCTPVSLAVPDRVLLPDVQLEATKEEDVYRLQLTAGDGVDLRGACREGPRFPSGRGFGVGLVEGAKINCRCGGITATVRIVAGPQVPAKVLLPGIESGGNTVEGIAYIPPPPPFFLNAMAEDVAKYIDVDGVRTRYFEKGRGEVLILVHGGQPSAADYNAWEWQQNFDGLAEHFRVIALDRIGQGGTDNPASLDDYNDYYPLVVKHLHGFIRAMGLTRVHLLGHSQGGWPVTRLAVDHPELVASLVIVDSTMIAPAAPAANAVRTVGFYIYIQNELHPAGGETAESIRRGMALFSHTNNNITEQRVQRILALSRTEKYAVARDWFEAKAMSPAHPGFRMLKTKISAELSAGGLRVPTLIIWGKEDPEGSYPAGVAFYEALAEAGTDVRFFGFENSGHVPYMEYPSVFNARVIDFIQR